MARRESVRSRAHVRTCETAKAESDTLTPWLAIRGMPAKLRWSVELGREDGADRGAEVERLVEADDLVRSEQRLARVVNEDEMADVEDVT